MKTCPECGRRYLGLLGGRCPQCPLEPKTMNPPADTCDRCSQDPCECELPVSPPAEMTDEEALENADVEDMLLERQTPAATHLALGLALRMLECHEHGDSRCVSNEFVALAAVESGDTSPEVMKVIEDGLRIDWQPHVCGDTHIEVTSQGLVLTPAERQHLLGLMEAGIAAHDDLPPGGGIFQRKAAEMLPLYQSIKAKLEQP